MPKEADPAKLRALKAIFSDRASNVPGMKETAVTGGHRPDEGLRNLFPEVAETAARNGLKIAIFASLAAGKSPTVRESRGDAEMQIDPATEYHFRVRLFDMPIFAKVVVDWETDEPDAFVISVKRDDQAWK